jgi:hypothetical protein
MNVKIRTTNVVMNIVKLFAIELRLKFDAELRVFTKLSPTISPDAANSSKPLDEL